MRYPLKAINITAFSIQRQNVVDEMFSDFHPHKKCSREIVSHPKILFLSARCD
jgi:hypothetical protein